MRFQKLLLLPIFVAIQSLYAADSAQVFSNKDLDGLYYVTPLNSSVDYLVLSHDGTSLPKKSDDPEAPTKPGIYYKETHFPIATLKVNKEVVSFETAVVNKIQFRFKGKIQSESDPQFDVPLKSLHGTIEMIDKGKIVQQQKIIFEEGVVN